MKTLHRQFIPAAAFAALTATSAGAAEEPTLESLIHPQSKVEIGIGAIGGDAHRFGMFNGMSDSDVTPLFDASILHRDDASGTWLRFFGANYGVDGGQARFEHEKQGHWSYYIEGGRATFDNPRIIDSNLNGLGSSTNTLGVGARRELDLEMHRDKVKAGGGVNLKGDIKVDFSARVERKSGQRQWGVQGPNFAVEPIDFTTQEYQGNISYTGKQLQVQGGYIGSVFTNDDKVLNSASTSEPQLSLPLDNMMHQVYVNGGYSFTPTTRGTFNASYGRQTQSDGFFTAPTQAGNTRTDLGGKVDNMLFNLGLSSRPFTDFSTRLKLRYEERDDNTALAQYVASGGTRSGFNVPFSRDTTTADAEADYKLPMDFKLVGGVGYEHWNRTSPPIRHASFRTETDEVTGRLELRRPLLESLSGSLGYSHSERHGSDHQRVTSGQTAGVADPILWADRSRDKARATLDWAPRGDFSVQFVGEATRDKYTDDRLFGPSDGHSYLASLDANYKLADDWDLSGWVARSEISIEQRTRTDPGTPPAPTPVNTPWEADLRHTSTAAGVSLRGKATDKIKVGADAQRSVDTSKHGIASLTATAVPPSLPDIVYRQWLLTLTGDYALKDNYGVKLKYGFAHTTARDWSWQNFTYADGTTVRIPDSEQTHFAGVSLYYRW
jgi:MtrB/PioB family decaheme-associated outer membrane protein